MRNLRKDPLNNTIYLDLYPEMNNSFSNNDSNNNDDDSDDATSREEDGISGMSVSKRDQARNHLDTLRSQANFAGP